VQFCPLVTYRVLVCCENLCRERLICIFNKSPRGLFFDLIGWISPHNKI